MEFQEDKLHENCLRCGRKLKNPINKKRGYGDVCFKKYMAEHVNDNKKKLFKAE